MAHDSFSGEKALTWWRRLNGLNAQEDEAHNAGDTGARARLRRAATPVEALTEARAVELARMLGMDAETSPQKLETVGALAAVLAHVRINVGATKMAALLGPQKGDERPVMSDLRFRRLLAARTPVDLMRQMRAAVQLLKGRGNVADIAHAMLHWNDATRVRWTYAYWQAAFASPAPESETPQAEMHV